MINSNDYLTYQWKSEDGERTHSLLFVTAEMIREAHTTDECESFFKFFNGQTGIITDDGKLGIYADDYERWLEQGKPTRQLGEWD